MLGKIVDVNVLRSKTANGKRSEPGSAVQLGRVTNTARFFPPEERNRPVYLVGVNRYTRRCNGRVIAMVQFENQPDCRPVVAPVKCYFYEPQLRQLLGAYEQKKIAQLKCLYEKSCGAVIFRKETDGIRFLLIKNIKGKNWGFPKGHVELGENEEQTAIREVLEETSLNIQIIPGFRSVIQYTIWGRANKQVVFFLAENRSSDVRVQASEIEKYSWMSYEEAMETFRFDNDRKVLKNAMTWMKKNGMA